MRGSVPSKPTFFLKPSTSFLPTLPDNVTFIEVPPGVDLHHEVELGVVIGKRAKNVSEADAMKHVAGYVLALDMTARNLQNEAKAAGMPWTISKGYDTFCPIDADHFFPASQITDPHNLELWLKVNGEERQRGNTKDMNFKIPTLISYISNIMTLEENDLILTGTPHGIGPVKPGDTITAGITGHTEVMFGVLVKKVASKM